MSSRKRNSSTIDTAGGGVLKNAKSDEISQSHQLSSTNFNRSAADYYSSMSSSSSQQPLISSQPADGLLIPTLQSIADQMRQMNVTLQLINSTLQSMATAVSYQ